MKRLSAKGTYRLVMYGLLMAALTVTAGGCRAGDRLQVKELRTEYRLDPVGIGTPIPRLSWTLRSGGRGSSQAAYRILVVGSQGSFSKEQDLLWDSGKVESPESLNITYAGSPLSSSRRYAWKVRVWDQKGRPSSWSRPASWETALLQPEDWSAFWICDGKPEPAEDVDLYGDDPAPLFRKSFSLPQKPFEARLSITGLGYYEARINGRRVGENVLDPGWTDYSDRILFSTYDVTSLLKKGENCLAVTLGNGWYNPLPLRMWGRLNLREHLTIGRPRLIAQIVLHFPDGSIRRVASDTSWKTHEGPLLRNNIYLGEVYDARLEIPGWDIPGFDDSDWANVVSAPDPGGRLEAQAQPPVKITENVIPVRLTEPERGTYIFDCGENFAGWARLKLAAPKGTTIRLRYGELLHPDGTLNPMTSVCGQIKGFRPDGSPVGGPGAPELAVQQDIYIAAGRKEEIYVPTFTYHAFRYVEVTGLPARPRLTDLTGLRLHAAVEPAGRFFCSDSRFNRIQDMTRRTFLSNLFSVQSDCPHRERFGYGGDLAATADAFMMNFDMASFYAKSVRDWQDASLPDGMLTDTAPFVGIQYCGVGWALVHPLLQENLFRYYGDRRLMEEQYQVSRRWLELVASRHPDHIISEGLSDHESLEPTPSPPLVTPLYAESARLLGRLAELLGKTGEAESYRRLQKDIRRVYVEAFLEPGTGRVQPHTQAGQAFALALDLLPPEESDRALQVLIDDIRDNHNGRLSTGIYGTAFLLDVLSRTGHADLAAAIVRGNTFPGWGFMLKEGATTLWEHWALSDNTYSHNHPMFGSVSGWFFHWLAGIQPHPQARGFDRILICPQPVPDLDWVKAEYRSVRGPIRVHWKCRGGRFVLQLSIPPNIMADVFVPTSDFKSVKEGGRRLQRLEGIKGIREENGCAVFSVESGSYTFTSIYAPDEGPDDKGGRDGNQR